MLSPCTCVSLEMQKYTSTIIGSSVAHVFAPLIVYWLQEEPENSSTIWVKPEHYNPNTYTDCDTVNCDFTMFCELYCGSIKNLKTERLFRVHKDMKVMRWEPMPVRFNSLALLCSSSSWHIPPWSLDDCQSPPTWQSRFIVTETVYSLLVPACPFGCQQS